MKILIYFLLLNAFFFVNCTNFYSTQQTIAQTIGNILQQLKPNECVWQLKLYWKGLTNMERWALDMFDASAKPQHSILTGNIIHVGNYEECLQINAVVKESQIKGQYCSMMWSPSEDYGQGFSQLIDGIVNNQQTQVDAEEYINNLKRSFGVCVPAACKPEHLNEIIKVVEKRLKLPVTLTFLEEFCDVDERKPADNGAVAALTIFSFFGVIVIASTLYDVLIYQNTKDRNMQIFVAFSLYSNIKRLLKTGPSEDSLNCLNGIRVISMMWIVLGHRYMFTFFMPLINAVDLLKWLDKTENTFFLASPLAVDTFFIVSGLLVVYTFLKHNEKGTRQSWPLFYLHRILRLTPSLAMVVLFSGTLVDYFCKGPVCPVIYTYIQQACEKNWWTTLIYLQNYLNPNEQCVGQSWYLAVDTQLYFLSPLLLIPLIKWPKFTIIFSLILSFLSSAFVFEVTWRYRLGSLFIDQNENQFDHNYSQTHTRANVWIIGAICGYFIFQYRNTKLKLTKLKVILLWGLALGIMLGIILSHVIFIRNEYDIVSSAFFNSLNKPAWAFALCLIIILCVKGYGGIINRFLSCTVFNVLIRLNYNIYLLHMLVILFVLTQERTQGYFSNGQVLHNFWGDYIYTLTAAVLWTLTFESPVTVLEKIIFKKRDKNKENIEVVYNNNVSKIFGNRDDQETAGNDVKIKINSYHKIHEF